MERHSTRVNVTQDTQDGQLEPVKPNNPLSLEYLCDLLTALEHEVGELPSPAPLFAHELKRALVETLGVTGDDS